VYHPAQQIQSVVAGQVHGEPFTQDQSRCAGGDLVEQARVGDRGADQPVVRALRVDAGTQVDHVRVVDVEPCHPLAGVDPVHPGVQTAAQVHHRGPVVHGEELPGPGVEVFGPGRDSGGLAAGDGGAPPVEVDPGHRVPGVGVVQNRVSRVGVEGLGVQRRQHGLGWPGEVDGDSSAHRLDATPVE
jgi:hypothetical protein